MKRPFEYEKRQIKSKIYRSILSNKINITKTRSILKGPQSRIFLFHKSHFYPYMNLLNSFLKLKIQKKTLKKKLKILARSRASPP